MEHAFVPHPQRSAPRADVARRAFEALAVPVERCYAWLGSAAPAVYLQSALLGASGVASLWTATYASIALGVLLLLASHVLVLAARRLEPRHDPWSAFLDQVCCRLVEVAAIAAVGRLAAHGIQGAPGFLVSWQPLATTSAAALAVAAAATVLAWRFLRTLADLHLLRSSLLRNRRVPGPTLLWDAGASHARLRPRREWLLLMVAVGILLAQFHVLLAAVALVHLAAAAGETLRLRSRLERPEDAASLVLAPGYR